MVITLRLSDDETSALRAAADRDGASMEDVARRAIAAYVDGWGRERSAFLSHFAGENRGLLDRLAQ